MNNEMIPRVYRETVAAFGKGGVGRREAVESTVETLMVEVRAGRLEVDLEAALRAEIMKADEADGRAADRIILSATKHGQPPLDGVDLEVVVTLGGGRRKSWGDVVTADLESMLAVRFDNYSSVRRAFHEFRDAVALLRPVLWAHGTFGDAFEAQAFPIDLEAVA